MKKNKSFVGVILKQINMKSNKFVVVLKELTNNCQLKIKTKYLMIKGLFFRKPILVFYVKKEKLITVEVRKSINEFCDKNNYCVMIQSGKEMSKSH